MKIRFKVGDRVKLRYVDHLDLTTVDGITDLLEQKGTVSKQTYLCPRITFDNGVIEYFYYKQLVKLKNKVK